MVARVLGVVLVLLALGAGAGWALAGLRDGPPLAVATAEPMPASSPSVPVQPEATYAPDIDYPALAPDLTYDQHTVGQGGFRWGYVAPTGWVADQIGPSEVTWGPPGHPGGGYGMRVEIVSERKTPQAMVEQKIADLADSVDDVVVLGRTTDSLAITYRAAPSGRLRCTTFRWFTGADPDAQFEVSVTGRERDQSGLGDLLDQISASVRPEPSDPTDPDPSDPDTTPGS